MTHKRHNKSVEQKASLEMPHQQQLRVEIEQLAYQLYCQCGYEHGHDLEHWAEAERQVLERHHRKGAKGG